MSEQSTQHNAAMTVAPPALVGRTLEAQFVAEITEFDATSTLSSIELEALQSVWDQHPVLIFPRQEMSASALERVASQLGEIGSDPYIRPAQTGGRVVEVRREAFETAPIFGASWHSDWSFQAEPPRATLLHAVVVPPAGGDTFFANCTHAYAHLDNETKGLIADLNAIHTAAPSYGPNGLFARDDASRSMRIVISSEAERRQTHPLVRTHPTTGEKSLFINHVYSTAIEGFEEGASQALLSRLFKHMTANRFLYRHRWQANMLVAWDNRRLLHYAEGGYEGHQRLMHRITLAGERPR